MTQQWDNESKRALIAYRINRADDTLKEAELMFQEGYYNGAINRLYYACYYATIALLLKNDIQAQTHSGESIVRSSFCFEKDNSIRNRQNTHFTF